MVHKRLIGGGWRARGGVLAAAGLVLAGATLPASASGGPFLGAARSFAVLAFSTVASTGTTSVTGDVGVSAGSAITGFPPATVTAGAIHAADPTAAQAAADAALAYDFLKGMPSITANNLTGTNLGGLTLTPGVYKFNTSAQLTGDLTLDAQGDSGALFVFQLGSTLTTGSTSSVRVINGGADYDESNVFWQVGSSATLGSGTDFTGNILAYASVTLVTGTTLHGSALALNGGVTLQSATVVSPSPVGGPLPYPAAPRNLTAVSIPGAVWTGADVQWTDFSDTETQFRIFRSDVSAPGFVQVGTVSTSDRTGTGGVLTYRDQVIDPSVQYRYRVTAYSLTNGESSPSNEGSVSPVGAGPGRLVLNLHRSHSVIRDRKGAGLDDVSLKGSYSVVGTTVTDPRVADFSIQVRAPGSLIFVTIPANDPHWRASKHGKYRWSTRAGRREPASTVEFDTRKSTFSLKSKKYDFSAVPVNDITVAVVCQLVAGSDTQSWDRPRKVPRGMRAVFTLSK